MFMLLLGILTSAQISISTYPFIRINAPTVVETFAVGEPQQTAEWSEKPSIRVCASTEIPYYRIKRAVAYWESLGYEFGEITKDPFSTCMNARYGEIIITLPEGSFSDAHMASTRLYTDKTTGAIVKAKICILPKNGRKDRVLEHEIGHALGWSHYRQRLHIMHPNWHAGGYDSYGIRKR